jgi:hypothetical protein
MGRQNAFDEFSAVFDGIVDPYSRRKRCRRSRRTAPHERAAGVRVNRDLLQEVDKRPSWSPTS